MTNILGYLISFFIGLFASLVASVIYRNYRENKNRKPLNQILNFGKGDDLIFVFSHREFAKSTPEVLLPRTSTEDFMAINNIKSALIKIGWRNKDLVRDTKTIKSRMSDHKKNIVSVCSCKTNTFTENIEDNLNNGKKRFFHTKYHPRTKEWVVTDGKAVYPTKTYEQYNNYINSKVEKVDIPSKTFDDVAYITKVTNPYNSKNKIMIIAGVRGIGTWGAAECIKKEYMQIYDKLPKGEKGSDFSALLFIEYDNMDIIKIQVDEVVTL